jgi:hypothetical protein
MSLNFIFLTGSGCSVNLNFIQSIYQSFCGESTFKMHVFLDKCLRFGKRHQVAQVILLGELAREFDHRNFYLERIIKATKIRNQFFFFFLNINPERIVTGGGFFAPIQIRINQNFSKIIGFGGNCFPSFLSQVFHMTVIYQGFANQSIHFLILFQYLSVFDFLLLHFGPPFQTLAKAS